MSLYNKYLLIVPAPNELRLLMIEVNEVRMRQQKDLMMDQYGLADEALNASRYE
jgi:hypothetical protein